MKFRRLLLTSIILSFVMLGTRLAEVRGNFEALAISRAQAQEDLIKDKDIEAAKAKMIEDAAKGAQADGSVKVDQETGDKKEATSDAEKPATTDAAAKPEAEAEKQEETKEEPKEHAKEEAKPEVKEGEAKSEEEKSLLPPDGVPSNPLFYSDAEIEVLQQLSTRRQELDERERSLIQKESLLKVTEERLDQKIEELNAIKKNLTEIQATVMKSVGEVDKKQEEEMKKLVKTYETMKPKDAARIFDETDIDIVFDIASRMKEAKLAPVLANMDSKKAKTITSMLAERKKVPDPETDAVKGLSGSGMDAMAPKAEPNTPIPLTPQPVTPN